MELRSVAITMRDNYVTKCTCDCGYTDILWCAHTVAALLTWNRERVSKKKADSSAASEGLSIIQVDKLLKAVHG